MANGSIPITVTKPAPVLSSKNIIDLVGDVFEPLLVGTKLLRNLGALVVPKIVESGGIWIWNLLVLE
jgi:hypothetical protein